MTGSPAAPILTDKQKAILAFVRDFRASHGDLGPRLTDVAQHFDMTKEGVRDHFIRLSHKGLLTYESRSPRCVQLVEPAASRALM